MVHRVLVALDGTSASKTVLEIACALADKYQAALGLLSVVERTDFSDDQLRAAEVEGVIPKNTDYSSYFDTSLGGYGISDTYAETAHAAQATQLANLVSDTIVADAAAFSSDHPFQAVKTFVRSGDPANEILEVARENYADIIMMGHDQQGRLEGILKGSVAEKVQRKATCPVLIYSQPKPE